MAGAHRVEPPVLRVAQPVDRMRGAVRLRTIRGWNEVGSMATPLQHPHGHGSTAVRRRPRGHAPQALRTRPCGRRPRDLPGPLEPLRPPRACAAVLALQDRVEQAPPQRDRGTEPPPRLARRFPTIGADRARVLARHDGLRCARTRARARLQRRRRGGRHDAHPQETPPADGGRDVDLRPRHPGQLRIGHQSGWHLLRVGDRGAAKRRATAGQPRPRPAHGIPAEDRGQRITRHPPLPQGEGFFDRIGARNHRGHDARGAQSEDRPGRLHCHPAHDQVVCDRSVAVVQGEALVHPCGTQFRVLAEHLGQRLPRLCRVVHLFSILRFTCQRSTDRLVAHGWFSVPPCCAGLVSLQYEGIS